MIDINIVLDRLKNILNLKRDIDLSEKLGRSRSTVAVWRKRGNIDYETIIEFAIKNNISLDFLFKNEKIKEDEVDLSNKLLEEFVFYNLKRTLFKENIFNKFNANIQFLFRVVREKKNYVNYIKENAKEVLLNIVKNYEIKSLLESDIKKENIIKLIEEEMSNLDCYVFLKYFDKMSPST